MKIAIITGANRGLGFGFVKVLAKNGYYVYATMRDTANFQFVHENVKPIQLDVSDDTSIIEFINQIIQKNEKISLLVNNAGLNKDTVANNKDLVCKLESLDRSALNKMFNINATSPMILAKNIVPHMGKKSLILNISSNRGSFHDEDQNSSPNYGYRASKAALNMLTVALSEDLPKDIFTVAVHPGGVKTDMNPIGPTDPTNAAKEIIETFIDSWDESMNGRFFNRDGSIFPY